MIQASKFHSEQILETLEKPTLLHRTIQCLYPLEISLQEKAVSPPNLPEANPDDNCAYPDDTHRGVLQRRWRAGSPWMLEQCDEAGREKQSSPTFHLQ